MRDRSDFGAQQHRRIVAIHAELANALSGEIEPERASALVAQLALATVDAAFGTCRKFHDDGQYAGLKAVFDDDGLRYCCTGKPQHCTRVIVQ
jgi:hypothetical protein